MQYPNQEDNYNVDEFNRIFRQLNDASVELGNKIDSEISRSKSFDDDIEQLVSGISKRLNALADSDDETLDQLSEIVAYIKSNRGLIDSITTSKVSVSDIVDNLTSAATNKPLSAKQGKVLKELIDTMTSTIPAAVAVKGNAETEYRTGNVNLTPANIGAFPNVINVVQTSTDLNDYITVGIYYFANDSTLANIPTGVNGWLIVIPGLGKVVKQIWYRHGTANKNDYNTFVRTKDGGGKWSNWTKFITERDIDIPVVLTGTLAANTTSITFTNIAITDAATIDTYTDVFGVNPTNITINGNKITLTFTARSADTRVKVKIS